MRHLFVSVLFALSSAASAPAQKTCDTCSVPRLSSTPTAAAAPAIVDQSGDDLRALDAERDRASIRGDRAFVAALLDDNFLRVSETGELGKKQEELDNLRPPDPDSKTAKTAEDVRVQLFGDTGIVTAKKKVTFVMNGHPDSYQYRETGTYVRRDGRWRLVSSQLSEEQASYSAPDIAFDLDFDDSSSLGSPKAEVVVYEFSDYECPVCRQFAAQTLPRIVKDYVQPGRVALVLRDFPMDMHPRAFAAATAGACAAAQHKRWPVTEKIMQDPVALSDDDLRNAALAAGVTAREFDRCVADPATAAAIRSGMDEAFRIGVKGTPMFVVGVRKPGERKVHAIRLIEGALPYATFQATLDGVMRARGL